MTCTQDTYIGGRKAGKDGVISFLNINFSPHDEVVAFLEKINFKDKSWTFFIEKHNGEKFIQHNDSNGRYGAYKLGEGHRIDENSWRIEGSDYLERDDGSWRGKFEILSDTEFYIHMDVREHGYHRYRATTERYIGGESPAIYEATWFEIDLKDNRFKPTHYVYRGDMGGGENHPRSWNLQGSEDGKSFTDLKVHELD